MKSQHWTKKAALWFLVAALTLQSFERYSYVEAELEHLNASGNQKLVVVSLQATGFILSAAIGPWIATKISIANVGRLGALLAIAIASFFMLMNGGGSWISICQGISILIGFDDGLLFTSLLAGVLHTTTTPKSRGLTLGWIVSLTILSYLVGSDESGVLSFDRTLINSAVQDDDKLLFFIMGAVSLIALLCLSLTGSLEAEDYQPSTAIRRILDGKAVLRYQWWKPFTDAQGVAWGCFLLFEYMLLIAFLRAYFLEEFPDYGWTDAFAHDIYFYGALAFLLVMPLTGYLGTVYGNLRILTIGQFLIMLPLITLGIMAQTEYASKVGIAVIAILFGLSATFSVGVCLAYLVECMEATYERQEGMITASLFLLSLISGGLIAHWLRPYVSEQHAAYTYFEMAGAAFFVGLMAVVLTSLELLTNRPRPEKPDERYSLKHLTAKSEENSWQPYVLNNNEFPNGNL